MHSTDRRMGRGRDWGVRSGHCDGECPLCGARPDSEQFRTASRTRRPGC